MSFGVGALTLAIVFVVMIAVVLGSGYVTIAPLASKHDNISNDNNDDDMTMMTTTMMATATTRELQQLRQLLQYRLNNHDHDDHLYPPFY